MKILSKSVFALAAMLLLAPIFTTTAVADRDVDDFFDAKAAKLFATMPNGANFPEGIAYNPNNNQVIVATFNPTEVGTNKIVWFDLDGGVVGEIVIDAPVLGLAYNPADEMIYVCNPGDVTGGGDSRIQRFPAAFNLGNTLIDVALVPVIGGPSDRTVGNPDGSTDIIDFGDGARVPNDLTFDGADLYYSDSFQGAVFKIADPAENCPGECITETISHDPLLATAGFPPFGANGVAIKGDTLFVANTGDDTIVKIDLRGELPASILAQSINGADGMVYDADNDLLWVAANQADQIVGINPETGKPVAELGEFLGMKKNGAARGLIFPASLVIGEDDDGKDAIFITNLALPVNAIFFGVPGGEPEEDVTKYTVSKINIPEFDD